MSFLHIEYFIPISVGLFIYAYFYLKHNKRFFSWVKDYWFYDRSVAHKISSWMYLLGLSLLMLALLDLRGPEKNINAKTVDQKTVILIDSSASMLAEDVRPNRFEKAILLVKHYLKRAVGQKISIIVFSDGQKKLVPFTDDYNIINARLDTLEELNLSRGGTGLSLAIQESVQYFKNTTDEVVGNILVFTDAEETDGGLNIDIPDDIAVGVVGVGTSKGATIPIRNKRGVFQGNKKHNGEVVISKLDNKFLESLGEKIKNYRYWVATSYSLPTDEIISFFKGTFQKNLSSNSFKIRPVYMHWLVIPGLILIGVSFLLGRRKTFIMLSVLIFSFFSFGQVTVPGYQMPNNNIPSEKEKEPVKSEETLQLEEALAQGRLDEEGKKALAAKLLEDKFPEDANALYEETLQKEIVSDNIEHQFNHATALLNLDTKNKAIKKYNDILEHIEKNPSDKNNEIAQMIKKNILKAFQQQSGKSGKSGDKQKKEKDSKNKDSQSGDSQNNQQDQKKQQKKDQSDKNSSDQKKDKKSKQNGDDKEDRKKENKPETSEERGKRKKKLPALLKQLMSDDNKLQKKMIDAETMKRKGREKKDW
ncbi:MAG: VWA domain-containing protein [Bacteriovoracaceae bacterium]|jgi:Ca-activated chloride channel family protein|nr:VWA domain-containing protein [Bacteriovoracaceae bacterium]